MAKKIIVIPNPANVFEKVSCDEKKRIVTVGRLSYVKGHHVLIQAFSKIKDKSWELSIVGDGVEKQNLEKLANDLQIQDRVLFHGHLKDFALQLSEAQIFVLPSLKEGFPNALIEAMSLPIACISGNYYGGEHDIVVHGENGYLVEPGNVKQLVDAIQLLIEDEGLRKKIADKAFDVRETLDFRKIANKYLEVILREDNLKFYEP